MAHDAGGRELESSVDAADGIKARLCGGGDVAYPPALRVHQDGPELRAKSVKPSPGKNVLLAQGAADPNAKSVLLAQGVADEQEGESVLVRGACVGKPLLVDSDDCQPPHLLRASPPLTRISMPVP